MLKIRFSKFAKKFIEKLPPKQKRQVIEKSLSLEVDSLPHDSKPLKGYAGYFRTDIGEYRIIYSITELIISIELVDKRNDDQIYRKFRRLF